jgi:hypothetical protein
MRILLTTLLLCLSLSAQEYRGTINGRVTDPSGATIAGAKVRVTNMETGVASDATTNDEGNYQAPFLLPGNYSATAEKSGFKKAVRNDIRVGTGTQVTIDFLLEVGAATETVNVTAQAPMIETSDSDLGLVMNHDYVANIAVSIYRNALNFARLAPGVTGQPAGTYTSDNQQQIAISGGGATQGSNEVILDGVPDTVPLSSGSVVYVPSVDSVEEVKVNTTMFDAAYGHSNGGAVTIVTRAGGNQPHGSAYLFKRWAALNANSWSNDRFGVAKPPLNYHQWGYFLSGPVYLPKIYNGRNRTFFSTSLERDADIRDLSEQARVPTALERQGDFSQTLSRSGTPLTIYNPFSTVVTGGKAVRSAFANNVIPASLISPIGQAALNALPLPNLNVKPQIGALNWFEDATYAVGQRQSSVRIDHSITDRNRIFGRFSKLTRDQSPTVLIPGVHQYNGSGANIDHYLQWRTAFTVDDTHTFSPSFVGSLRYGFARRVNYEYWGGYGLDPSPFKLPAAITANQVITGYPEFNIGESVPSLGSRINHIANDSHALFSTFTKTFGNHTLKFGTDYRLIRYNSENVGTNGAGSFTFSPTFTQSDPFTASTSNTTGTALASTLLGAPSSGSLGYTSPLSLQSHYLGAFVQDAWKVSRRLTLNFGLRYELETPYTERYNRVAYGFDPGAALPVQVPGVPLHGGVQFAGVGGLSRREGNLDANNFGPRFGFAYQFLPKTVVRGGYGLFFSSQLDNIGGSLGSVGTFDAVTSYVGTTDSGATPFTTLANPFPGGFRTALGTTAGLMSQVGDSLSFVNPNRVSPYNQQWQISVQHELPSNVVVEAAYVGMLSVKELESYNLNDLPDIYLPLGTAQNTSVKNPFLGLFPGTSSLGQSTTISQKQLWLLYPQFTSLTENGANTGTSTYNALQVRVEKRFSHGLTVTGTYSFSKLMHNNMTSVVNTRNYRSISSLDQPQLFRLAFTYDLPGKFAGKGVQSVLRQVVGGWAVTGFLSLESGTPLSITQSNGRPLVIADPRVDGNVDNRLGDQKDAQGNIVNAYFNTKAFQALPTQFMASPQIPYISQLRAPGQRSLNASAFKNFAIYERMKLELRLEAINATNHPYFGAPGTNMSTAATFGVINSASNSRAMQGGLKLVF